MAINNGNTAADIAARLRSGGSSSTSSSSNTSYSGSAASGNAPVADLGGAGADLSGSSQDIFDRATANSIAGNVDGIDPTLVGQFSQATSFAQAQKKLSALQFTQTIGDIKNRIAQESIAQAQQDAVSGFQGTGGQARNQVALQQAATATFDAEAAAAESDQKSLNAEISTNRDAQITAMQPAIEQAFGQEAALSTLRGDENLVGIEKDQGFWAGVGSAFGKDVDYIGSLDTDAFKNNANMQDAAEALGLNINDENFLNEVEAASKNAFTASSNSAWSKSIDFKLDMGEGAEKIGSQELTTGQRWANGIGATFNVLGIAAVAAATIFTAGIAAGAVGGAVGLGGTLLTGLGGIIVPGTSALAIGGTAAAGIGLAATGAGIEAGVQAGGVYDTNVQQGSIDQAEVAQQAPATDTGIDITEENQAVAGRSNNTSQDNMEQQVSAQARKIYSEEELQSFTPENYAMAEGMINSTMKVFEDIMEGNQVDPQILQELDTQGVDINDITQEDAEKISIMNGLSMLANNRVNTDVMKSYIESNPAVQAQMQQAQAAQPQGV